MSKWLCGVMVASFLAVAGCKKAPETAPPTPAVDVNAPPRDRPVDPNTPGHLAKPDEARVQLDLAGARAAVTGHQQLNNGASPPSLSVLGLSLSFPNDLTYDPATGIVKSKSYPHH